MFDDENDNNDVKYGIDDDKQSGCDNSDSLMSI